MREKIFSAIALPFFLIALTFISFGEGGWHQVVKDWKEFFQYNQPWRYED